MYLWFWLGVDKPDYFDDIKIPHWHMFLVNNSINKNIITKNINKVIKQYLQFPSVMKRQNKLIPWGTTSIHATDWLSRGSARVLISPFFVPGAMTLPLAWGLRQWRVKELSACSPFISFRALSVSCFSLCSVVTVNVSSCVMCNFVPFCVANSCAGICSKFMCYLQQCNNFKPRHTTL